MVLSMAQHIFGDNSVEPVFTNPVSFVLMEFPNANNKNNGTAFKMICDEMEWNVFVLPHTMHMCSHHSTHIVPKCKKPRTNAIYALSILNNYLQFVCIFSTGVRFDHLLKRRTKKMNIACCHRRTVCVLQTCFC